MEGLHNANYHKRDSKISHQTYRFRSVVLYIAVDSLINFLKLLSDIF